MLSGQSRKSLQNLKIVPGAIVHIFCPHLTNPKNKFVLITHVDLEDDLVLGFLINSNIHPVIAANPDKSACQVEMKQEYYSHFLNRDSHLDCSKVQEEFGCEDLAAHLANTPNDHKGMLRAEELVIVLEIVNAARTITPYDKELILNSLGNADLS